MFLFTINTNSVVHFFPNSQRSASIVISVTHEKTAELTEKIVNRNSIFD